MSITKTLLGLESSDEVTEVPSSIQRGNDIHGDEVAPDEFNGVKHRYVISGYTAGNNPSFDEGDHDSQCTILFQNGNPADGGFNGVTAQDLITVCICLFEDYQSSKFKCEENERVLNHLKAAKDLILTRLKRREEEGLLGTQEG